MRWCLALLICCFLAVVNALSSSGSRLLAVLEDTDQKDLYSTLWADLKGKLNVCELTSNMLTLEFQARGYDVSIESPKSDQLALFKHGERAYDHLLILPPKSKGEQFQFNWSDGKSIDRTI